MSKIKPFPALRPDPQLAEQICELPYDVLSSEEARQAAAGNPLSFFHVSKPEIDLPADVDPYDPAVYAKGKENFEKLIAEGALRQEKEPTYYFYRQIMGDHAQTGLVAVASCEEYLANQIKKHEFTRPDKENDRVRHVETLNAQTGPVFLTYRAVPAIDRLAAKTMEESPDIDFTAPDGVRHSTWPLRDPRLIQLLQSEFEAIPALYIADGHHRSAAAARVFEQRGGAGASGWFLSVIFPHNQMQILPYNRALKDLNNHTPEDLLEKLKQVFDMEAGASPQPRQVHQVSLYLDGQWHSLRFKEQLLQSGNPAETLDVSLLQQHVLGPLFGVDNPRTSTRIAFVGGIRGTGELEKLVSSGSYACAFSMFPTRIEDLMAIADADGIMPPKSTWFEPKLRDALFSHLIA